MLTVGAFISCFRFINSHNRKHVGFQVAVNHLADRSPKELRVLRGRTHSYGYNGGLLFHPDLATLEDVPDTLDWRLYGNPTYMLVMQCFLVVCGAICRHRRMCTERKHMSKHFISNVFYKGNRNPSLYV